MIQKEVFLTEIIAKIEKKRLILPDKYTLLLKINNPKAKSSPVQERDVSLTTFSTYQKGEVLPLVLYTNNQKNWYFSKQEAEIATE